ncbi:30S ribosomal protein S17 [Salsipaludibacter albus]|uniref:30S ribosomal protein S17 n=1 Tax=Salsipaludibacter albus TaxID=2849650 RepID=UPI001EE4685E|nr:30S ribosomal protein S17 [Salsipaludibacter albus]MBY5161571.1 30S ribosomal protein S17 [Salsipaludibacter albus]
MSDTHTELGTDAGRKARKQRQGLVVSDKQDKTIVVRVDRRTTDAVYGKIETRSKKYHVHDEDNTAAEGDTVLIVETRPLSKTKRWRLAEVLERAE